MSREEIAEWVGYYFGLQRAGNMRVFIGDDAAAYGAAIAINKLRLMLDIEMRRVVEKLPPNTIETWPRKVG